jgi:hypothetical protein
MLPEMRVRREEEGSVASRRNNAQNTKITRKQERHDEYFVGKKSKDRLSKKKVSMYEKM